MKLAKLTAVHGNEVRGSFEARKATLLTVQTKKRKEGVMNDFDCLVISISLRRRQSAGNEIYLSNLKVETLQRTLTLYYYSARSRTNPSYIFLYAKLYDMLFAKWRLRRYTLHEAMMSSRKTIRPCNVDAQGILNCCGGAAVSREAPACLRVRITGNDIQRY